MGARGAPPRAGPSIRAPWLGLALMVVATVGLVAFVAEPLRVTSGSMRPTLSSGDTVVVDKLTGRWRAPEIGDLVVFHDPRAGELAVKRVVALGGQEVALEDGVLHVDGVRRDGPGIDLEGVDSVYFGPVTVPVGAVFLMGDNRADSIDSRDFGPVRLDDLVGRVVLAVRL